jgi:hypothetical protein
MIAQVIGVGAAYRRFAGFALHRPALINMKDDPHQ